MAAPTLLGASLVVQFRFQANRVEIFMVKASIFPLQTSPAQLSGAQNALPIQTSNAMTSRERIASGLAELYASLDGSVSAMV